jgi:hypothetical protein
MAATRSEPQTRTAPPRVAGAPPLSPLRPLRVVPAAAVARPPAPPVPARGGKIFWIGQLSGCSDFSQTRFYSNQLVPEKRTTEPTNQFYDGEPELCIGCTAPCVSFLVTEDFLLILVTCLRQLRRTHLKCHPE